MANSDVDSLSVAVCHGHYLGEGGGEAVAEELARTFDAPIYYGFGYDEYTPDDIETHSLYNDIPLASTIKGTPELRDLWYMKAFQHVPELHDYDVIVQSGNEMGWYVPKDDQALVKYTHSPIRSVYDRFQDRARSGSLPQRALFGAYTFAARQLYETTLSYPYEFVANSEVVERRIHKYWGLGKHQDCRVIYPPTHTESYGRDRDFGRPTDDPYYLCLDRLEPTKNIDRAVSAFQDLEDLELVVAGDGNMKPELVEMASDSDNIRFYGHVSERTKRALLAHAEALVYCAENEDFGIVPIEAFASGTPVIGPREGFTQQQIDDGTNGYLYESDVRSLRDMIRTFEVNGVRASSSAIESFAERFDVSVFREKMRACVEDAIKKNSIDTDLSFSDRPKITE